MSVIDAVIAKKLCGGGGGQFIVTVYNTNVSGTTFAADKTYEEISAAIESGMCVVIHKKTNINSTTYQVYQHNETQKVYHRFCHISYRDSIEVYSIALRNNNGEMVIDIQSKKIQIVTS